MSLIAALIMQSCERLDSNLNNTEDVVQNKEASNYNRKADNENNSLKIGSSEEFHKDEGDEPARDKQHWRILSDSIR